jgi:hypothetical protein
VILGFDHTEDHGLCVAVMVRHSPGDPWRIDHAFAPPGVTEQDVRDFVAKHMRVEPQPPGWSDERPVHEVVAEWAESYVAGDERPLKLDDTQRAMIAAAFADGRVSDSWWVAARGRR